MLHSFRRAPGHGRGLSAVNLVFLPAERSTSDEADWAVSPDTYFPPLFDMSIRFWRNESMPEMMKGLSAFEQGAVLVVLAISIFGIIYAFVLRAQILRQDKGTPRMQEVWGWIK